MLQLKSSFNILLLRFYFVKIFSWDLLKSYKKTNEVQDLKMLIFIKRYALLCRPAMMKEVIFCWNTCQANLLAVTLCMKKRHVFNANIKYLNSDNSSNEKLKWKINLLRNSRHLKMTTTNRRKIEKQDTHQSCVK